jgi:hypothetical protein
MTSDVRPDDVQDDEDAVERGMTVAAVATLLTIGVAWLGLVLAWLHAMHRAGTGKGLW